MSSEPIISVSGLRGIVGKSLTPAVVDRYIRAFADQLPPGDVVVTRDGRASGARFAQVVHGTLAACGRTARDGGIAATPTTGVLVRQFGAAGGVQISASHNPPQYNGLKLFSGAGRVLPASAGEQVLARYRALTAASPVDEPATTARPIADPSARHLELVLATVDVGRIAARNFNVLLDANHGAGSVLGIPLLEALGCRVTVLGGQPDGQFAHPPEPTAENLASVTALVLEAQADVGFCQDPDADRLAIIDAGGRYLGEEYTLALCVENVLRSTPGPVVTNCATSRMSEEIAARFGVPFFRSAVGEANVVDVMLAQGAVIGGEGNGGAIDPRVGLVRDSFVGMALVLDAMASRDAPVAQLTGALPRYAMCKTKIELPPERLASALAALEAHFSDARVERLDGLRLDWPQAWLLVRPSNTEPIVRAIAEAPTSQQAAALCAQAERVLRGA
ncbi:MAG: phosphoglucosamine mutase [Pirellulales bacterium]